MKISHIIIYDIYRDGIILLELYMILFPGLLDIFLSIQVVLNTCDVVCQNPFGHVSDIFVGLERNRYYKLESVIMTH